MSRATAEAIAAECLVMRLRRLNRELTRLYDDAARPHALTAGRATVLVAVGTTPGVTAADLVEPMFMEKSSLSRTLARLESDGLLRTESDGRARRLFLTQAGYDKIDAIYADWQTVQATARERLGELGVLLLAQDH